MEKQNGKKRRHVSSPLSVSVHQELLSDADDRNREFK